MTIELVELVESFTKEADKGYKEWQDAEDQQIKKEDEYKKVLLKIKQKPTMELLKKKVELSGELEQLSELTNFAREAYQEYVKTHYDDEFRNELSAIVRNDNIPNNELEAEQEAISKLKEFIQSYDNLSALESERVRGYVKALIPYRNHLNNAGIGHNYGDSHLINNYKQTRLKSALYTDASDFGSLENDRNLFPTLKSKASKL